MRYDEYDGVPGAIAGKFTVSRIPEKFVLMVAPILISKNNRFLAIFGETGSFANRVKISVTLVEN
jgi:hypothetical protein